jgi:hypothetical protein
VYLAWTDYRSGDDGQVYLAWSNDGGSTFVPGRPVINGDLVQAGMQRGAQFVIDNSGAIHFVWHERNSLGKISARYARSTDGGTTFSQPLAVAGDDGRHNQDFPSIAVDSTRGVYLAWIDDREVGSTGHTQLFFTRSLDGGTTFDPPKRAGTMPDGGGSCECCNTSIAVSPAGDVHISFRSNIDNNRDTWIARSLDRGGTFTVHKAASESWKINACPMTGSSIALDRDGTAHVVWRDSRTSSAGKDYIFYTSLPRNSQVCDLDRRISDSPRRSNFPSLGILPNGSLFVAFQDNRNDQSDIYYVTSLGGSLPFSPGVKLSHETGESVQELASVAVAPDGTVYVAWEDDQRDEGDVMISSSRSSTSSVSSRAINERRLHVRPNVISQGEPAIITFVSRGDERVRLSLVDALGCEVAVFVDDVRDAGEHRFSLSDIAIPSGTYTCVLRVGADRYSQRVIVQR